VGAISEIFNRAKRRREEKSQRNKIRRKYSSHRSKFHLEALEPRFLLSGDLVVSEIQPTASGVNVQSDQPVDASVLNLYDIESGALGQADVELVGASTGAVKGSLIVNGDTINFVKTGGVLAADTYTLTLRSGSDGFKALSGGLLDGNNDGISGDDYVNEFVITPFSSPIVGIADFARGPGQTVNVPATDAGVPISISDGTNVTSVSLTLAYDSALLEIEELHLGLSLPDGTVIQSNLAVPGIVTLKIISPTAMGPGPVELVRIHSSVPHDAAYGEAALLDITQVSVNNGAISAIEDDGVQVVAYFGETTGNQGYSALDAQRVLRVAVGLDSGFAAYPRIDPVMIADITSNSSLSALDGTRILQEVVGLNRAEIGPITPVILSALTNDTGASHVDALTSDPALTGTVTDDGAIVSFRASLDSTLVKNFFDVTADLQNGSFSFSRARLEQILGGFLADGEHTLYLQATDNEGNTSPLANLDFTLDTFAPVVAAPDLLPSSDTGISNADSITADSTPTVRVFADSDTTVRLLVDGIQQTQGISVNGVVTLTLPALSDGSHALASIAEDLAGNLSPLSQVLSIVVDSAPPALAVTAPGDGGTITPAAHLTGITGGTGSDLSSVTYRFDSGASHALAIASDGAFDQLLATNGLIAGERTLTVTATDLAGNVARTDVDVVLQGVPFALTSFTPADGAEGVGVFVHPRINFSAAVNPTTLTSAAFFATVGGETFAANIVADPSGLYARLFFDEPMPGGTLVRVTVIGSTILAQSGGAALDADKNGAPGGDLQFSFATANTVALPGTMITGRIADSGPDMIPQTVDDTLAGPDGVMGTSDDILLLPLLGVKVFVRGLEADFKLTGADGKFFFDAAPGGAITLTMQGEFANAPAGFTFPELNADLEMIVGKNNDIGTIYMPRFAAATVQSVNNSATTVLTLPPAGAIGLTEEQRQLFTLQLAPGTLLGANGLPVSNAQVVMSLVPDAAITPFLPDTMPDPTLVFTTQLRGASDIAKPFVATFPNLSGALVGERFVVLSFDQVTGKLVQDGTAIAVASGANPNASLAAANGEFEQQGDMIIWDPGEEGGLVACFHIVVPGGGAGSSGPGSRPENNEPPDDTSDEEIDLRFLVGGQSDTIELAFTPPSDPDATKVVNVTLGNSFFEDFYDNSGDNRIRTETLTLHAGDVPVTRSATLRTLENLLARVNGGRPLDDDRLYGSQITVVETTTLEDGSSHELTKIILPYLYLDYADDDPTDHSLRFRDTLFTGNVKTQRTVNLVTAGAPTPSFVFEGQASSDFNGTTQALGFDPQALGSRSATLRIRVNVGLHEVTSPTGVAVGGTGTAPTTILLNKSGFLAAATGPRFNMNAAEAEALFAGTTQRAEELFAQLGGDVSVALAFSDGAAATGPTVRIAWSFADNEINDLNGNGCIDPGEFNDINGNGQVDPGEFNDLNGNGTLELDNYGGLSPIDINANAADKLLDGKLGKAQQAFVMDSFFNPSKNEVSGIFIDTHLGLSGNRPAPVMMGNTLAHEVSHTLGLLHSDHMGVGALDVMHSRNPLNATWSNASRYAALMALDAAPTVEQIFLSTIPAYLLGFQTPDPSNECSLVPFADDGFSTVPPSLAVLDPTSDASFFDTIDFGAVSADGAGGAVGTINALLHNSGGIDMIIGALSVTGAGFSIAGVAPGAVVGPSTSIPITLTFDPTVQGDLQATLALQTNSLSIPADTNGIVHFTLRGRAVDPNPVMTLQVSGGNNNVGGVELGTSTTTSGLLVVSNGGGVNLVFSPAVLDGDSDFDLGAFEGVAQILSPGASLAIPLTFSPSALGLRPGTISFTSNDPDLPVLKQAVVGTGIPLGGVGIDDFDWGKDFVRVTSDSKTTRVVSSADGAFQVVLRPGSAYDVIVFDPVSGLVAQSIGATNQLGGFTDITRPLAFRASIAPDSDGDGLPNDIEDAIGSSAADTDSDDDGLDDFVEIANGLNPLDGIAGHAGVIGALSLPGDAWDIAVAEDKAYIATGDRGLAIVDISRPERPIMVGTRDLGGLNVSVAIDETRGLAAIASNDFVDPALHIVDVSTPSRPQVLRTIAMPGGASHVEVFDGVAYVASGEAIISVEMVSGDILHSLDLGSASITGLAREAKTLFAMDSANTLHAIDTSAFLTMAELDTLSLLHGGGQLFVGGGIAYAANASGLRGGFATVDVSDPGNLTLISNSDVASGIRPDRAVAVDGSEQALVIGNAPNPQEPGRTIDVVDVADIADPTNTNSFLTRFILPEFPLGLALANGVALIADGASDLLVVGYQSADGAGQAPSVTLATLNADAAPGLAGFQVIENTAIHLVVDAADDVGVRMVEILVNGQVVDTDASFPYESLIASGGASATLQVQASATDAAGNTALSNLLSIEIIPDTIAPTILAIDPPDGATLGAGIRKVQVRFSESLAGATVSTETFRVVDEFGTTVAPTDFLLRSEDRVVELSFGGLAAGSYQLVIAAAQVTDRAGNALGVDDFISTFTLSDATIRWVNPTGGFWDVAANWDLGRLPGPEDSVFIDIRDDSGVIEHRTGTSVITSLVSKEPIRLTGGTLDASGTIRVDSSFRLINGTLRHALVQRGNPDLGVSIESFVTLDGVTLATEVMVADAVAVIQNGLTLDSAPLTLLSGEILFDGAQSLGGTGDIVFSGPDSDNRLSVSDGPLTINSGISIGGDQGGRIEGGTDGLILEGKVAADTAGKTITIDGNWTNNGMLQSRAGTLELDGTFTFGDRGTFVGITGTVTLVGTLDNTGKTFAITADTGTLFADGGTLKGGRLETSGGATLTPAFTVTLDGVTLGSNLTVPDGRDVFVRNGLTLDNVNVTFTDGTVNLVNARMRFLDSSTLGGEGEIVFAGTGDNNQLVGSSGATLTIGPNITVHGTQGGTVGLSGNLVNQGTISSETNPFGITVSGTTVSNQGTIQALNGGDILLVGPFTNTGLINVGAAGSQVRMLAGTYVQNSGETRIAGGTLIAPTVSLQNGMFTGFGTVTGALINNAAITIGGTNSAGNLQVSNGYTQTAAGVLNIEIGGVTAGTLFDRLQITGAANLAGTLNVSLINGFTPISGQNFAIVTFTSHGTTTFDTINGLDIGGGLVFNPIYNSNNLTLQAAPAPGLFAEDQTELTQTLDAELTLAPASTFVASETDPLDPQSLNLNEEQSAQTIEPESGVDAIDGQSTTMSSAAAILSGFTENVDAQITDTESATVTQSVAPVTAVENNDTLIRASSFSVDVNYGKANVPFNDALIKFPTLFDLDRDKTIKDLSRVVAVFDMPSIRLNEPNDLSDGGWLSPRDIQRRMFGSNHRRVPMIRWD